MKKLLAILFLASALACVRAEDAKPVVQVQKWEYAQFERSNGGVAWIQGTQIIFCAEIPELRRKLASVNILHGQGAEGMGAYPELFQAIGDAGWEMVSATVSNDGISEVYFKRPKQ